MPPSQGRALSITTGLSAQRHLQMVAVVPLRFFLDKRNEPLSRRCLSQMIRETCCDFQLFCCLSQPLWCRGAWPREHSPRSPFPQGSAGSGQTGDAPGDGGLWALLPTFFRSRHICGSASWYERGVASCPPVLSTAGKQRCAAHSPRNSDVPSYTLSPCS